MTNGQRHGAEYIAGEIINLLRLTKSAVVKDKFLQPSDRSEGFPYAVIEWPSLGIPFRQLLAFRSDGDADPTDSDAIRERFNSLMIENRAHGGLIVYTERVPQELQLSLQNSPNVQAKAYDELVQSALDVDAYVNKWFPQHLPTTLESYYVTRRWRRLAITERDLSVPNTPEIGSLSTYVDEWLHGNVNPRQLAVLSDAGSGKTWFCWDCCARQMVKYQADPNSERLPIYIRLRDYSKFYDIVLFITNKLEELGIRILGNYEGLRAFSRKFFLILDGFDEMESRRNQATIFRTFDEINRLITTESKVLLTSRKVMFHGLDRLKHLFAPTEPLPEEVLEMMPYDMGQASRSEFEILEIEPFDAEEIQEAIKKRALSQEDIINDRFDDDPNLVELATTPLLLDRLVDLLPRLRPDDLSEGDIYENLVREWVERPVREDRSFLRKTSLKVLFAEHFAWHLMVTGTDQLLYLEFPWHLSRIVKDLEENPLEDPIKDDLRTQTFLETDLNGYYRFTHPSFRDFFIARKLARGLNRRDGKDFGRLPLMNEKGVIGFLSDLIESSGMLWDVFDESKLKDVTDWTPTKRYAASNAATVLAHNKEPFSEKDLSNNDLSNSDLRNVDFGNCDLRGSNLEGANLTGSFLGNVLYDERTNFHGIKGWPESIKGVGDLLAEKIRSDQQIPVATFPHPPEDMALLPGGRFQMGSSDPRFPDEHPIHDVEIDPFYLDIHEVTNQQFYEFILDQSEWNRNEARERLGNEYYLELWNRSSASSESLPFSKRRLAHPVVYVSWFSVIAFCNWRSRKGGLECCYPSLEAWYLSLDEKALTPITADIPCNMNANGYRLPTEAEWEFAARGNHDQWEYPWGKEFDKSRVSDSKTTTTPVLTSEPDEFGVTGLIGNVREWCNDWYSPTYYREQSEKWKNPEGPKREKSIRHKVLRGGTMNRGPESHRCAFRSHVYPENTNVDAGFRCVRRIPNEIHRSSSS